MIPAADLRTHLEGPDHNAVLKDGTDGVPVTYRTHVALHRTVNRGWRANGLIGRLHPTFHEVNQPAEHELEMPTVPDGELDLDEWMAWRNAYIPGGER